MSLFTKAQSRLHNAAATHLSDGLVQYFNRDGKLIAEPKLMIEHNVERFDEIGGVKRWSTITALKETLKPLDRKGYFLFNNKQYALDDISSDDGYFITFFVKENA